MGGKTDVVKGRIKEAAGALTGNDKLREEGKTEQARREGRAGRPEDRRYGKESRETSGRVSPYQNDLWLCAKRRLPRHQQDAGSQGTESALILFEGVKKWKRSYFFRRCLRRPVIRSCTCWAEAAFSARS